MIFDMLAVFRTYLNPKGHSNVDGCLGKLLRKRGEDSFEVFIPPSGCTQLL